MRSADGGGRSAAGRRQGKAGKPQSADGICRDGASARTGRGRFCRFSREGHLAQGAGPLKRLVAGWARLSKTTRSRERFADARSNAMDADWGRIIGVKAEAGRRALIRHWQRQISGRSALPIKLEPEWPAERGKGSFCGVGFRGFQGNIVNLTG